MATWPSPASRAPSSWKSNGSWDEAMAAERSRVHPEDPDAATILIVDDHEDNVEVLKARLESWGYRTASAMDGEAALMQAAKVRPDLVLLDVMMPQIDGYEVARRLKADDDLKYIPIIMQTALDSTEDKVEG